MTLSKKIALQIVLPLLAFVLMAGYVTTQAWNQRQLAKAINDSSLFFLEASSLINQVQIERGKSALHLGAGLSFSEVEAQRAVVDSKLLKFREAVEKIAFDPATRNIAEQAITALRSVRKEVEAKVAGSVAAPLYTKLIQDLLSLQISAARLSKYDGIETYLNSLTVLEMIKENSGRMRASITNILSLDTAISGAQIAQLEILKFGISTALNSSALILSATGQEGITKFMQSPDWAFVLQSYDTVLRRSAQGKYGVVPAEFFGAVSRSIVAIDKVVIAEIQLVTTRATEGRNRADSLFVTLLLVAILFSVCLVIVSGKFIYGLSRQLGEVANNMEHQSRKVAGAAHQVSSASQELSASATESAAALQQTVASVDQISAMVGKNAENAGSCLTSSTSSLMSAELGKATVTEMLGAIEAINGSNQEIMAQIETSNREISEIIKVISDIGVKTRVINDIVFQTKLLSFNASVEAARAGEHGKGFSVVAEEVGNLAQMSGNAATEITQMLDGSIKKVEKIVEDTKMRVAGLVVTGKEKITTGVETATRCDTVLDEIVSNVKQLGSMVGEIAAASKEQAQGVQEITKAMGQLDLVTQQNASASQQASNAASQLLIEAESARGSAMNLSQIVQGNSAEAASSEARPPAAMGGAQSVHGIPNADRIEFGKAA